MRVLVVGPRWFGGWTEGVARAVRAGGHQATVFYSEDARLGGINEQAKGIIPESLQGLPRALAKRWRGLQRGLANRRLVATARREPVDLTIVLKGDTLDRPTLEALKEATTNMVSWWVDDPFRNTGIALQLDLCDRVFLFDRACIAELKAQGHDDIVYLPCAYDDEIFYPQPSKPEDHPALCCDVGLVASYDPSRRRLLGAMRGWNVGLWGPGWDAAPELSELPPGAWRGRSITPENAAIMYGLAKVCPNVHHPQTRLGGYNTRTFEIIAAGGFELVDHVPGLEDDFEVGKEIVAYSSPEEFRDLAEYYRTRPEERASIVQRGRLRVMREHTYKRRLETVFSALGL